jgi:hypothetical protein
MGFTSGKLLLFLSRLLSENLAVLETVEDGLSLALSVSGTKVTWLCVVYLSARIVKYEHITAGF